MHPRTTVRQISFNEYVQLFISLSAAGQTFYRQTVIFVDCFKANVFFILCSKVLGIKLMLFVRRAHSTGNMKLQHLT